MTGVMLTFKQADNFIYTLKGRFDDNMNRHTQDASMGGSKNPLAN